MKIKLLYLFLLMIIGLSSCTSESEPKQQEPAKRTILVYMVANNSLSSYSYYDIDEMQTAIRNYGLNNGRLLIYHAPISDAPKLLELTVKNNIVSTIEHKTYNNTTYSTDPERLEQVINDMESLAPALDYGLVLWSHSDAWREHTNSKSLLPTTGIKPLSFGDDRNHYMKVTSLADVLNKHNFSFIYFDCCHMASIEVAYELRNATDFIIGSAAELPAAGMPYDENLPLLFADTPQLEQACRNTFNYYNSQTGASKTCTISLISTEHIDELADISREIFQYQLFPSDYAPQPYVRNSMGACYLYDMSHFMHAITPDATTTLRYNMAFNQVVLYNAATPYIFNELKIDNHCGIGCYIVNNLDDKIANQYGYFNQSWWKDVASYRFTNQ